MITVDSGTEIGDVEALETVVEVDSVERPEGVVMVGMEKMDRVEREDEAPALMSENLEMEGKGVLVMAVVAEESL